MEKRKPIKQESISDIVCFGYMHKWCKSSEVRLLEKENEILIEALESIRNQTCERWTNMKATKALSKIQELRREG